MSWEKDLQEYAEQTRMDPPSLAEAQALVARARRSAPAPRRMVRWGLAAAAAAALVVVLWPGDEPTVEVPVVAIIMAPEVEIPAPLVAPRLLGPGRAELGADAVEVMEGGRVTVISEAASDGPSAHTRLRLDQGRARFEVGKRTGGATFSVVAGDFQVRVIGTAFEVERSPFQVLVESGVVAVLQHTQQWTLRAGDRFSEGRVVRAAVAPPVPELDALRRLVLSGNLAQARAGLKLRLDADPADVGARVLAAQLETKLGKRDAAVRHWERVIARGSPTQAQRARYEAAVLLSGSPPQAERHLRAFLETRGPLTADARLALGRALLAQGKSDAARAQLEQLVREHPGATPARVARELLQAQ
jgi:hypothetical protein